MELKQYQLDTRRTLPDLGTYQLNICHMIFGMNAEFNELLNATDLTNLQEETGDVIWYLSNYCNYTELKLSTISFNIPEKVEGTIWNKLFLYFTLQPVTDKQKFASKDILIKIQVAISRLTDLEKKELAYKKKVDPRQRYELVKEILLAIVDCYHYYDLDFYDSLQKNIDKLKVRYPEKFTEALADNRDLETERKVLEGKMKITKLPGLENQPIIASKPAIIKENSSKKEK